MDTELEKTKNYYNQESTAYSNKRYNGHVTSYVRFLFTKRQRLVEEAVGYVLKQVPNKISLLEIGCADGVLITKLVNRFNNRFSKLVGVDVAPGMIAEAKKHNHTNQIDYFVRDEQNEWEYNSGYPFDVILEIGFVTGKILEEGEIKSIKKLLAPNGYYLVSLAGRYSLQARFKLKGVSYLQNYRTYAHYEQLLSQIGDIVWQSPYGLFIPKLWSLPWPIALSLQKLVDTLGSFLCLNLFHEKLYLVKSRN